MQTEGVVVVAAVAVVEVAVVGVADTKTLHPKGLNIMKQFHQWHSSKNFFLV